MKYLQLFSAIFLSLLLFVSPVSAGETVDINRASVSELASVLKGVGESKAQAIVDYRNQNGPFSSVEQLAEVKGIGMKLIERNRASIQVLPNSQ